MEKIKITIPDNMTPQQEAFEIAKQLGKKMLPQGNLAIGNGYTIQHQQTVIEINRKPVKEPVVTRTCSVCSTIFLNKLGKPVYMNYGGAVRKRLYCSGECQEAVFVICGDRASKSRGKINYINYKTYQE